MKALPRRLALAAIRGYQRHLSPHKGFCCAYREHTGRASCSALGYRVVQRHGVFAGLGLLRERMRRCGDVHRACRATTPRPPPGQRGDCDCDLPWDCLDGCNCCDCSLFERKRAERQQRRQRRRAAPR